MKGLAASSRMAMPWKNGLGQTMEIARSPKGQDAFEFDWRISLAHVAGPGSFSQFPGVDRIIVQLTGAPMTLSFKENDRSNTTLKPFVPFFFPGEAAVEATLTGAGTDFNVMVRRTAFAADVEHLKVAPGLHKALVFKESVVLLYCLKGRFLALNDKERISAGEEDAILIEGKKDSDQTVTFIAETERAAALLVRLKPRR